MLNSLLSPGARGAVVSIDWCITRIGNLKMCYTLGMADGTFIVLQNRKSAGEDPYPPRYTSW